MIRHPLMGVLCLMALKVLSSNSTIFDGANYDIGATLNTFTIECGTSAEPSLHIKYEGYAESIYALADPDGCVAVQVNTGVFIIQDARLHCPYQERLSPHIVTLDLVLQTDVVRSSSDNVHTITCNYERGDGGDADSHDTQDGSVNMLPEWHDVLADSPQSNLSLLVFNANNQEVTEAALGSYIQLRAHMTARGEEVSLKMWNCRAFLDDQEYYMLMNGCGEGTVIAVNRGFFTQSVYNIPYVTHRALSAFFTAFSLPGDTQLQFQCQYIFCTDTSCHGKSCASRRRRQADLPDYRNDPVSPDSQPTQDWSQVSGPTDDSTQYSHVVSKKIRILPPSDQSETEPDDRGLLIGDWGLEPTDYAPYTNDDEDDDVTNTPSNTTFFISLGAMAAASLLVAISVALICRLMAKKNAARNNGVDSPETQTMVI